MKRKSGYFLYAAVVCLAVFLCAACASKPKTYVPVNYTDEDIRAHEIKDIQAMSAENPVKSLWRAKLLADSVPSDSAAAAAYADMFDITAAAFNTAVTEKKRTDAGRIFYSIQAVSGHSGDFTLNGWTIDDLYAAQRASWKSTSDLTVLDDTAGMDTATAETPSPAPAKVSQMIRGTVTIWVDRGIKIEKGMGYAERVIGSGFFIDKRGYIITNHHVISSEVDPSYEGYSRLYVKLADDPDTRIPAKVVGWDPVFDLALVKVAVEAPYVFTLGSSRGLDPGDRIYAIGSPAGLDRTLTSGIVSAVDRKLFSLGSVLQIDAAVNSGNSGGPIIDQEGAVQAVVFAGMEPYEGLNFAIPVEYLKMELDRLFAGGKIVHGWSGSYGRTYKEDGAGQSAGVEVLYVMPGGPASVAGIVPGDIITEADGVPVRSLEELQHFFLSRMSGSIIRLECKSGENVSDRYIYLDPRPLSPGLEIYERDITERAFLPVFGMSLVYTGSGFRKKYSVTSNVKGGIADESGFSVQDPIEISKIKPMPEQNMLYIEIYAN